MKTFTSKRFPLYAVTVYPYKRYHGGSGWFLHEEGNREKSYSPQELNAKAGADVTEELTTIARRVHSE